MDSHQWFGMLLTLIYAVVLPALVITAGVWAAQLGGERRSPSGRRATEEESERL